MAAQVSAHYGYVMATDTMDGVANVLTLHFFLTGARGKYGTEPIVTYENHVYRRTAYFAQLCQNDEFVRYMQDVLDYGTWRFEMAYIGHEDDLVAGFVRYAKYSRKDVSRILNYEQNREGTLNGYAIVGKTCPIFVTYNKRDDITANTKYEDEFVSSQVFSWMTRARVRLESKQVQQIMDPSVRKLLFIKKSDAEGRDFYYLGDVTILGQPVQTTIANDKGEHLPIVNFQLLLDKPVEEKLYSYLT